MKRTESELTEEIWRVQEALKRQEADIEQQQQQADVRLTRFAAAPPPPCVDPAPFLCSRCSPPPRRGRWSSRARRARRISQPERLPWRRVSFTRWRAARCSSPSRRKWASFGFSVLLKSGKRKKIYTQKKSFKMFYPNKASTLVIQVSQWQHKEGRKEDR